MEKELDCLTYNVAQVAVLLGISTTAVYGMAKKDKSFPAIRAGGRILLPKDRFHKWLQEK